MFSDCMKFMEDDYEEDAVKEIQCECPRMGDCRACQKDDLAREKVKGLVKPIFMCPIHAEYRDYQVHFLALQVLLKL